MTNTTSLSTTSSVAGILSSRYNQTTSASTPLGANTRQKTKQEVLFKEKKVRFEEDKTGYQIVHPVFANPNIESIFLRRSSINTQRIQGLARQCCNTENRATPDFLSNIKQEGRTTSNFLSGDQMYDMKKINAARRQIYQLQQGKKIDTYQSSDINTTQSKQVLQEKLRMYNNSHLLHLAEKTEYCYVKRSTQYSRGKKEANVLNHQKPPLYPKITHWQASVMGPGKQMTIANLDVKNEVPKLNQQFEKPTLQQCLLRNNGYPPIHSLQARTRRG